MKLQSNQGIVNDEEQMTNQDSYRQMPADKKIYFQKIRAWNKQVATYSIAILIASIILIVIAGIIVPIIIHSTKKTPKYTFDSLICKKQWQVYAYDKCLDSCELETCRECFNGKCGKYSQNQEFMAQYNNFESEFKQEKGIHDPKQIVFPLSTKNMKIVDATGKRVKIAGANWYGFQLQRQVISGLDKRPLSQIVSQIKSVFGINTIRLPYSIQMIQQTNPVDPKYLTKNQFLIGKTPLQVMDAVIQQLTQQKVMVYLNNHNSNSGWCCNQNDGNGLWYNSKYNEQKFFQVGQKMAMRYRNNPYVIGIDLRNQIRKDQGKNPAWNYYNVDYDRNWRRAAKIAAQRVQKIAPHWLIIIGGLQFQTDMKDIVKFPIDLSIPNKVVYSGHIYAWSFENQTWNSSEQAYRVFFDQQIHVRGIGAPFLLGQFGENSNSFYWQKINQILREKDLDWTYWALDGYKNNPSEDQTFGLYDQNFNTVRHQWKLADLRRIGAVII